MPHLAVNTIKFVPLNLTCLRFNSRLSDLLILPLCTSTGVQDTPSLFDAGILRSTSSTYCAPACSCLTTLLGLTDPPFNSIGTTTNLPFELP